MSRHEQLMADLVDLIAAAPPPRRAELEEAYWALAADRHGAEKAAWYREEFEWVRARTGRADFATNGAMSTSPSPGSGSTPTR